MDSHTVNEFDGKAAQVFPQNVEKLPLFHWRPGKRLLCVGSRDGATFDDQVQEAEKNTFLRPLSAELLHISQTKMHTDGLCATFSAGLFYPHNLNLMRDQRRGYFALVSPGYGDPELLAELKPDLDAVVLMLGPKPGPLTASMMSLGPAVHVEVLWGIDQTLPQLDLPWEQVKAVHLSSLRPHGSLVEQRQTWYEEARQQIPAQIPIYNDDHSHTHCVCGETLVWRSGGRSRIDQIDESTSSCLNCKRDITIQL